MYVPMCGDAKLIISAIEIQNIYLRISQKPNQIIEIQVID